MRVRKNRALVGLGLVGLLGLAGGCGDAAPAETRRLVVIGVDGLDPVLTRQLMAAGQLANLEALARTGGFTELGTSNPPQSPVAWSNFITGQDSAGHGIYDFVHRDPVEMAPYLSTSRPEDARSLDLFGWRIPLGSSEMKLLRDGEPFWQVLAEHGVPATVMKIPAHFPPNDTGAVHTLAGMGTPDLLGTYGTFQVLTDDPAWTKRSVSGGMVEKLTPVASGASGKLNGPPHPMRVSQEPLTIPVDIRFNKLKNAAMVRLGNEERILQVGEWSEWIPIAFDPGALGGSIGGIVRLLLKSATPHITLYVSPINLDPVDPAMPISWPRDWAQELAADTGRFYTQGMPEDTKALEGGVLSDDEFLAQVDIIIEEERALLRRQLQRFRSGLLFHYFSVVDQTSHMFWRTLDPKAPEALKRYADVLPNLYARIDVIVGEVRRAIGPNTTLIVMSDHGFAPYRFKVNLNTWLLQRGYLTLRDSPGPGALGHIDWSRTQAYALGINMLFLNRKGREAEGIVPADQVEVLATRLSRELEGWVDPVSGARPISRTFRLAEGKYPGRSPDLLIGFGRGYRSSDQSATGIPEEKIVVLNKDKWSGDHCMDPALVPGVLFSNRKLTAKEASLVDLAPTILSFFGIEPPEAVAGKPLL